jgi:hypothetical protein
LLLGGSQRQRQCRQHVTETLPSTGVFIFGTLQAHTPPMLRAQAEGIDLPMKARVRYFVDG